MQNAYIPLNICADTVNNDLVFAEILLIRWLIIAEGAVAGLALPAEPFSVAGCGSGVAAVVGSCCPSAYVSVIIERIGFFFAQL